LGLYQNFKFGTGGVLGWF